jgi:ankyrin repeat protein
MAGELGANSDLCWDEDDCEPLLVEAAMHGHSAEVRSVLAEGADVNKVGANGFSALTWASIGNHLEIATVLLAAPPGPALSAALGRITAGPDAAVTARALTFASPEFQQR